jgi:membrane-bound ClpP family serine protease
MSVLALLLLAVAGCLFLAEAAAPGVGAAGVAGATSFVLGVALLAGDPPGPTLDVAVAAPVALAAAVALAIAGRQVVRTHRGPTLASGPGLLLGQETTVRLVPGGPPQGFVAGAWWTLRSAGDPLTDGDRVAIIDVDDLVLVVEPSPASPLSNPEGTNR